MHSINLVAGRLGTDPELKHTPKNKTFCNLTVAETRPVKNADNQWEYRAVWHRLTAWGPVVERAVRILRKGSLGLFHYRVDYKRQTVQRKDGSPGEADLPNLTLTDFDALADFGRQRG